MTRFHTLAAGALIATATALPGFADEEVSHYEPLPSETLEQAMENFVTYNRKMEEVLARDPLTVQDMEEVHELTYTIEVALAKINEEIGALAPTLEEIHQLSEGDEPAQLKAVGATYLEQAKLLDR